MILDFFYNYNLLVWQYLHVTLIINKSKSYLQYPKHVLVN